MNSFEEKIFIDLLNSLNIHKKQSCKILEVGCGIGLNLEILKRNGYINIVGVDISNDMVKISKGKGFNAFNVHDFKNLNNELYDIILFSHVLEHVSYDNLQPLMESYFKFLNDNAKVIIIMPTLYDGFYNDIDHIKPYYPNGLMALFSNNIMSKQYYSKYSLVLNKFILRKEPIIPYFCQFEIKYGDFNFFKKIIFNGFNIFMKILKFISLDYISKTTGYISLFTLKKNK